MRQNNVLCAMQEDSNMQIEKLQVSGCAHSAILVAVSK